MLNKMFFIASIIKVRYQYIIEFVAWGYDFLKYKKRTPSPGKSLYQWNPETIVVINVLIVDFFKTCIKEEKNIYIYKKSLYSNRYIIYLLAFHVKKIIYLE